MSKHSDKKWLLWLNDRRRLIWAMIVVLCAAAMAYAYYAEHILGLDPCNLCMLQRGSMTALGLIAFLACAHNPTQTVFKLGYAIVADLAALSGLILAGRHVYLQHLPEDQVPACGPPFDYLVSHFPIMDVIQEIFTGSGACAEVKWSFLGFSMPEVLLVVFAGLLLVCQIQLLTSLIKSPERETPEKSS